MRVAALGVALIGALLGCRPSTDAGRCDLIAGRRPTVMTFTTHGERITDGVSARPGAPWNSSLTSVISGGGGVEWDLGRIEPLAKAWLEADHNDGYALCASTDRRHWTTVWEAPPVDGGGLRVRSSEGLAGEARYLRLEPRGGDSFYSVAELAVAGPGCSGPWPRLAERAGDTTELPSEPPLGRSVVLAAALGAAALLWACLSRHRQRTPSWRDPLLVTGTAVGIFVVATALTYAVGHRFNVADDAYISFVYAKNWISGLGLVFNPGERVEGYTNFLWVALLAPLWSLSAHDPVVMTRLATFLALAFAVLALLLLALIARRVFPRVRFAAVLAMLMVAFDDSFVSYTTVFALENHLLMALMLAGLALVLYRPRHWDLALGGSFALAGMTRPDAVLWPLAFFAVYGAALAARRTPADDDRVSGASLVRAGAVFVILFGAYFAWRAWYFGEPLPNTFYLKTGATLGALHRGLAYLRSYAAERLWVPVLAIAALVLSRSAWSRWLVVHTALHAAYVAYVGGDFYAGSRFLLVLAPNLALLVALVLVRAFEALGGRRAAWVAPAAALAACLAVRWGTLRYGPYTADLHGFGSHVDNNVKYMQWLRDVARPDASMVVGDIGATGLFTDVRAIDVFGVVDRTVAHKQVGGFGTGWPGHEKRLTREEQLARNPTYIKWGYVDDSRPPPGYYIFNDFPRHLRVEGLWVKDDLAVGRVLEDATWHLDPPELSRWQPSGTAFSAAPSREAARDQMPIKGARGTFIDTFTDDEGDRATGRLLSPPFELVGDRMRLLVGGGRDPERLRVSLLVGERRVFSETGNDWETLGRREWDIAPLRGQTARIEIVDQATGAWGHLLVDEIEQWSGNPDRSGKI